VKHSVAALALAVFLTTCVGSPAPADSTKSVHAYVRGVVREAWDYVKLYGRASIYNDGHRTITYAHVRISFIAANGSVVSTCQTDTRLIAVGAAEDAVCYLGDQPNYRDGLQQGHLRAEILETVGG
jgi:ABC-type Fe3+-hydroxamate transport system substrate-binding protein